MKRRWFLGLILFIASTCLAVFLATSAPAQTPELPAESLRYLADLQGFSIGSSAKSKPLKWTPKYGATFAREFNTLMPEYVLKFAHLHPERDVYDFSKADALFSFALARNMQVRGHTLVWFHALPRWLLEGNFSREELMAILEDHIKTTVGRYRGHIYAWDVVNEAVEADGSLRDSFWLQGIGPEYIDLSFRWAHEADPDAALFLNDYAEGMNSKSDAQYALVKGMIERGVPIDGVGFQAHLGFLSADDPQEVAENIKRLGELGLQVAFTEMDMPIQNLPGKTRKEKLDSQARLYREFFKICLDAPNCNDIIFWGLTDFYSWLKSFTGNSKSPLILDEDFNPKPAYFAIQEELRSRN